MIQTLDGHIAGQDGKCNFGSREDRRRMDQLRAQADAVLISRATLLADNPNLFDRRHPQSQRQPVPVVVLKNPSLKIPSDLRIFQRPHPRGIFIVMGTKPVGGEFHPPWTTLYCTNAQEIILALGRLGLHKLLIEGGPTLNTLFLKEDLVDEIRLTIAARLMGNSTPQRLIAPFAGAEQYQWLLKSCHRRGNEIFLRYLRDRRATPAI